MFNCEYCDKLVKRKKPIKQVNVSQNPSEHWFCSKNCREVWRYEVQKGRTRRIIEWIIGEYESKSFFLQRIIYVKAHRPFNTRFSYRFFNVKTLELTQRNTLKVVKV